MEIVAIEDRVSLGIQISKAHKAALDRIMAATRPTPTLRAMIEHLIEQEAIRRGIDDKRDARLKGGK